MPLFVVKNQYGDDKKRAVDASNVHDCVQHEIECLIVVLSGERRSGESFALNYIFGHVQRIKKLILQDGDTSQAVRNFLFLWHRTPSLVVTELEFAGIRMVWDDNARSLLHQICDHQVHLSKIVISLRDSPLGVSGLRLTSVRELILPLGSNRPVLDLADALPRNCLLELLDIRDFKLAAISDNVLTCLGHKLGRLCNLKRLCIDFVNASPSTLKSPSRTLSHTFSLSLPLCTFHSITNHECR